MVILLAEPLLTGLRVLDDVGRWSAGRVRLGARGRRHRNRVHLRALLDRMPKLRVMRQGRQLRHLDLDEAAERGIEVMSIDPEPPRCGRRRRQPEETFALLLALVRNVPGRSTR